LTRQDFAWTIATGLGLGRLPKAPGTWASAAATLVAWPIVESGGSFALAALCLLALALGLWACKQAPPGGPTDAPEIVVDEIAGQWLALLAAPLDPLAFLMAFLLFRVADIAKPWPASAINRDLHGPAGIMLDDIAAGFYALVAVALAAGAGWFA
jgi:phosphatidylglycerophosphatase A